VRRYPNHHLGFGFGPHFCLGATLARIELRAIFEVLIPRVTHFDLAGPIVRARSSFLNAIKEPPPSRLIASLPPRPQIRLLV
jgi:cholest-4-en-3-one 26-monooxygenase